MPKTRNINYNYNVRNNTGYGLGKFLIDLLLVGLTGGVWIVWIFIREMRRRSR